MSKSTSVVPKSKKITMSPLNLCTDGVIVEKLNLSKLQVEQDYTCQKTLENSLEKNLLKLKEKKSAIQESHQQSKKVILKDKLHISKKIIPDVKLSMTSEVDSISKGKDLKPFWTEFTQEMSQKLLSCTKIDCVDLDMNLWNTSAKKLGLKSWFSVKLKEIKKTTLKNSQKTYCPLLMSSLREITALEQVKIDKGGLKSKKIKLYPTKNQRKKLNEWFGTARWTYNQALSHVQKGEKINLKNLRNLCVNNNNFANENCWVKETPYDVRDESLRDLIKNYKSNLAKKKKNPGKMHKFSLKFKSRKRDDSIVINKKHWKKDKYFFPKFFGKKSIKSSEPLPEKLNTDTRLLRTRLGEFYLCIIDEVKCENQALYGDQIIALDPGVRTFCTGYSPSGIIAEWGEKDIERIYRLANNYDKLSSKMSHPKTRAVKRYIYRKARLRITKKIRNLVDDFHRKFCKWLLENFNTIILPSFETQDMVYKAKRKLNSKTARSLLTWSHYRFKQRLFSKAREYKNVHIIICNESYTSKTCSECGTIHNKLGGSKTFKCPECKQISDRDINASRNILLRYFTNSKKRVNFNHKTRE